jgi:hypothetical protein
MDQILGLRARISVKRYTHCCIHAGWPTGAFRRNDDGGRIPCSPWRAVRAVRGRCLHVCTSSQTNILLFLLLILLFGPCIPAVALPCVPHGARAACILPLRSYLLRASKSSSERRVTPRGQMHYTSHCVESHDALGTRRDSFFNVVSFAFDSCADRCQCAHTAPMSS